MTVSRSPVVVMASGAALGYQNRSRLCFPAFSTVGRLALATTVIAILVASNINLIADEPLDDENAMSLHLQVLTNSASKPIDRENAARDLREKFPGKLPVVRSFLDIIIDQSQPSQLRRLSAEGLRFSGSHARTAVAPLIAVLSIRPVDFGDVQIRVEAVKALGQFGQIAGSAARPLTQIVESENEDVRLRTEAVYALTAIGPPAFMCVTALSKIVVADSADRELRLASVIALGEICQNFQETLSSLEFLIARGPGDDLVFEASVESCAKVFKSLAEYPYELDLDSKVPDFLSVIALERSVNGIKTTLLRYSKKSGQSNRLNGIEGVDSAIMFAGTAQVTLMRRYSSNYLLRNAQTIIAVTAYAVLFFPFAGFWRIWKRVSPSTFKKFQREFQGRGSFKDVPLRIIGWIVGIHFVSRG